VYPVSVGDERMIGGSPRRLGLTGPGLLLKAAEAVCPAVWQGASASFSFEPGPWAPGGG